MDLCGLDRIEACIAAVHVTVEALVAAQADQLGRAVDAGQRGWNGIAATVVGLQRRQRQPQAGGFAAATLPAVVEQRLQQRHALRGLLAQVVLQVADGVVIDRQRAVGTRQRLRQMLDCRCRVVIVEVQRHQRGQDACIARQRQQRLLQIAPCQRRLLLHGRRPAGKLRGAAAALGIEVGQQWAVHQPLHGDQRGQRIATARLFDGRIPLLRVRGMRSIHRYIGRRLRGGSGSPRHVGQGRRAGQRGKQQHEKWGAAGHGGPPSMERTLNLLWQRRTSAVRLP